MTRKHDPNIPLCPEHQTPLRSIERGWWCQSVEHDDALFADEGWGARGKVGITAKNFYSFEEVEALMGWNR